VRYLFLKAEQAHFSLAALCRAMEVSESGFYAWRKRPDSRRKQQDKALLQQIQEVHQESEQTYGSPRVYQELKAQEVPCSEKRIAHLMHDHQISAQTSKRFVTTTQSDPALPVAQNVLDRQFTVETPNAKWTADITYVWTSEGWLYLAVILDLFSRRIVGWSMGNTLERSLVLSALSMAVTGRRPNTGLLCHSDRGSQYASGDYQTQLRAAGITGSMSRKGNCWDNAPTESFFASFKRELVHRTHFPTHEAARSAVFRWIEVWYNHKRRHSTLGYLSPEAFERQYQQKQQEQRPMAA
jgi:putative transposase